MKNQNSILSKMPLILLAGAIGFTAIACYRVLLNGWGNVLFLLVSATCLLFALPPKKNVLSDYTNDKLKSWEVWGFTGLVVVAVVTRMVALNSYPQGSAGHEGEMVGRCLTLANESYTPHIAEHDINWPSLLFYQGLFFAKWLGWELEHFRIPSALWGVVTIGGFYFAVRQFTSAFTALVSTMLLVGSSLHIGFSRWFFPGTIIAAAPVLALGCSLMGIKRKWKWSFFLAGLAIGLSLHGYFPGRTIPVIFAVWFVLLGWLPKTQRLSSQAWRYSLGGFFITATPIIYYALRFPEHYWGYLIHANPNQSESLFNYARTIWVNLPAYSRMFLFQGNWDFSLYGAYVPILEWGTGFLFVCGLFLCLIRFMEPIPLFCILLFLAGILPAMMGSGFEHPTVRRVILVIPAVYFMTAISVEHIRQIVVLHSSVWVKRIVLMVFVLLAISVMGQGIWKRIQLNQHPGARIANHYATYLAGQAAKKNKGAAITISPLISEHVTSYSLMPRDRKMKIATEPMDWFAVKGNQDQLFLMAPYLESGIGLLKQLYPDLKPIIHKETKRQLAFYMDPVFDRSIREKQSDPFNDFTYLIEMFITEATLQDGRGMVLLESSRSGEPEKALVPFRPAFYDYYQGQTVIIGGAFILPEEQPVSCSMQWNNWKLTLDGEEQQWNKPKTLVKGQHYFTISGRVLSEKTEAMPFQIKGKTGKLLNNQVIALKKPFGLKVDFTEGALSWDNVSHKKTEHSLLPLQRYWVGPLDVPCSVRMTGKITFPETGRYYIKAREFSHCSVAIESKVRFDNRNQLEKTFMQSVAVEQNKSYAFQLEGVIEAVLPSVRGMVLYYKKINDDHWKVLPQEWLTLY